MQQTYDMWLKKHNPGKPGEGTPISSREGEKQIQMPTDYADIMVMPRACWGPGSEPDWGPVVGRGSASGRGVRSGHPRSLCPQMGYHCWLCGKNSNSKKQWQQHIQSEKHKEKVFTSDSDASGWAYRFPMGEFRLCDRCLRGARHRRWTAVGLGRWTAWPDPCFAALDQIPEKAGTCQLAAGQRLPGERLVSGEVKPLAPGPAARGGKGTGLGQ